jgi:hypothetical protein
MTNREPTLKAYEIRRIATNQILPILHSVKNDEVKLQQILIFCWKKFMRNQTMRKKYPTNIENWYTHCPKHRLRNVLVSSIPIRSKWKMCPKIFWKNIMVWRKKTRRRRYAKPETPKMGNVYHG